MVSLQTIFSSSRHAVLGGQQPFVFRRAATSGGERRLFSMAAQTTSSIQRLSSCLPCCCVAVCLSMRSDRRRRKETVYSITFGAIFGNARRSRLSAWRHVARPFFVTALDSGHSRSAMAYGGALAPAGRTGGRNAVKHTGGARNSVRVVRGFLGDRQRRRRRSGNGASSCSGACRASASVSISCQWRNK